MCRYDSENLSTHDSQTLAAVCATNLTSLFKKAEDYGIIGIDEGQFVSDIFLSWINIYIRKYMFLELVTHFGFFSFQTHWNFPKQWPIRAK